MFLWKLVKNYKPKLETISKHLQKFHKWVNKGEKHKQKTMNKITFASSSLIEWSRKRPFVSYSSLKFSFVFGIDTTSAKKDIIWKIRLLAVSSVTRNEAKIILSKILEGILLNCNDTSGSSTYPWNQLGRSCQSWPSHQPWHVFASEWQWLLCR